MNLTLTAEQQQAVAAHSGKLVRLIDPQTNQAYVLLRADLYDQVKRLLEHEDDELSDTYPAQIESAMRAGWGDPIMDDYNDYDANHRKLCP